METSLRQYKTFVNLSLSEVLCTTILEALCMGKFVILPICPANDYFLKFKNCVFYHDQQSLLRAIEYTKHSAPSVENTDQFMILQRTAYIYYHSDDRRTSEYG